ncbi:hypothetical protein GEMRC1_002992 [Eukaryota sp. GEM-RC1]
MQNSKFSQIFGHLFFTDNTFDASEVNLKRRQGKESDKPQVQSPEQILAVIEGFITDDDVSVTDLIELFTEHQDPLVLKLCCLLVSDSIDVDSDLLLGTLSDLLSTHVLKDFQPQLFKFILNFLTKRALKGFVPF